MFVIFHRGSFPLHLDVSKKRDGDPETAEVLWPSTVLIYNNMRTMMIDAMKTMQQSMANVDGTINVEEFFPFVQYMLGGVFSYKEIVQLMVLPTRRVSVPHGCITYEVKAINMNPLPWGLSNIRVPTNTIEMLPSLYPSSEERTRNKLKVEQWVNQNNQIYPRTDPFPADMDEE